MTDMFEFSPRAIISMGLKRITPLVVKYGITSPEVFAACERWGGMLDEVNYPDSTCRWCGVAVSHTWEHELDGGPQWIHNETNEYKCWADAPAVASPVKTTESGVGFIPTRAKKPLQK